mmetsp:Transcript_44658/g.93052  ORF Transcript_44658/g.93052 Transcript_44658/m.93052 type:complete len:350 (-) Transcript_44658:19-1068(-)
MSTSTAPLEAASLIRSASSPKVSKSAVAASRSLLPCSASFIRPRFLLGSSSVSSSVSSPTSTTPLGVSSLFRSVSSPSDNKDAALFASSVPDDDGKTVVGLKVVGPNVDVSNVGKPLVGPNVDGPIVGKSLVGPKERNSSGLSSVGILSSPTENAKVGVPVGVFFGYSWVRATVGAPVGANMGMREGGDVVGGACGPGVVGLWLLWWCFSFFSSFFIFFIFFAAFSFLGSLSPGGRCFANLWDFAATAAPAAAPAVLSSAASIRTTRLWLSMRFRMKFSLRRDESAPGSFASVLSGAGPSLLLLLFILGSCRPGRSWESTSTDVASRTRTGRAIAAWKFLILSCRVVSL